MRHLLESMPPRTSYARNGDVHPGEIEVMDDDFGGIAAPIAARVVGLAVPPEVPASQTVCDLVGSGRRFTDRGAHALPGVTSERRMHAVEG